MSDERGMLEVEIIKARCLQIKPDARRLPCKCRRMLVRVVEKHTVALLYSSHSNEPSSLKLRPPVPYIKVYLMNNKKCIAKFKIDATEQTLNPSYHRRVLFRDDHRNCLLQIIIWGDYGKHDRKSLMGIVQIDLDHVDMSSVVVGWYRLFGAPAVVSSSSMSSSKLLRQTLSSSTTDQDELAVQ